MVRLLETCRPLHRLGKGPYKTVTLLRNMHHAMDHSCDCGFTAALSPSKGEVKAFQLRFFMSGQGAGMCCHERSSHCLQSQTTSQVAEMRFIGRGQVGLKRVVTFSQTMKRIKMIQDVQSDVIESSFRSYRILLSA